MGSFICPPRLGKDEHTIIDPFDELTMKGISAKPVPVELSEKLGAALTLQSADAYADPSTADAWTLIRSSWLEVFGASENIREFLTSGNGDALVMASAATAHLRDAIGYVAERISGSPSALPPSQPTRSTQLLLRRAGRDVNALAEVAFHTIEKAAGAIEGGWTSLRMTLGPQPEVGAQKRAADQFVLGLECVDDTLFVLNEVAQRLQPPAVERQ